MTESMIMTLVKCHCSRQQTLFSQHEPLLEQPGDALAAARHWIWLIRHCTQLPLCGLLQRRCGLFDGSYGSDVLDAGATDEYNTESQSWVRHIETRVQIGTKCCKRWWFPAHQVTPHMHPIWTAWSHRVVQRIIIRRRGWKQHWHGLRHRVGGLYATRCWTDQRWGRYKERPLWH